MQTYDSIICVYFCIKFIDYMLLDKKLTYFTNLFLPKNFKKNDKVILNCFLNLDKKKKWLEHLLIIVEGNSIME